MALGAKNPADRTPAATRVSGASFAKWRQSSRSGTFGRTRSTSSTARTETTSLRTRHVDSDAEEIQVTDELTGKSRGGITRRDFVHQGRRGRMFIVTRRTPPAAIAAPHASDPDDDAPVEPPADEEESTVKGTLNDSAFDASCCSPPAGESSSHGLRRSTS